MTRALGPRAGVSGDAAGPLALIAAMSAAITATGAAWLAGHGASAVTGHGWTGPAFGGDFAAAFLRHGPREGWPQVPPAAVWALFAVLLATIAGALGGLWWLYRAATANSGGAGRGRCGQGAAGLAREVVASLAGAEDVAELAPTGAAARAHRLRPSLDTTATKRGRRSGRSRRPAALDPAEVGVPLGCLHTLRRSGRVPLRASWEDVVLAVMAPRSGKTTALAVPAVLEAPGAVVATSNKSDLWAATAGLRAAATGERVWVFDPQRIAHAPQSWWWNPLRGLGSVEESARMALHFIQEVRGDKEREFWTSAAHDLLTNLLLAAALGGRDLGQVYSWLNDPTLPTPIELLREHGHPAAAAAVRGRVNGAPETRDGVYETARTAASCLRDPQIMAWLTPPGTPGLAEFDPAAFAASRQSLYLLSKDGAGAAAPLVAALTDRVLREGTRAAERAGGRLDPPMLVLLDEAANVCKIADLPDLYSHLGSRSIVPVTVLQSYRQGVRVWGEDGMAALWSASTVKLIGAGLDDPRFVEDISRLVGDHDIAVRSVSQGRGGPGESVSLRRQRILAPEDVRALPRFTALLLATGARPAILDLQPWPTGPRRAEITAAARAAEHDLTARAGAAPDTTTAPTPVGAAVPTQPRATHDTQTLR